MAGLTEIAPGVLVATSTYALTTTTVVAGSSGSGGCLVIDPAVTVAELAALAASLRPLDASTIPWDGPEARLIVHDGHAPGHGAVFLPGAGLLVAGDMCSDVEIPLLDTLAADPLGDYRTGVERLAAVPGVRQVIPRPRACRGRGRVPRAARGGFRVSGYRFGREAVP